MSPQILERPLTRSEVDPTSAGGSVVIPARARCLGPTLFAHDITSIVGGSELRCQLRGEAGTNSGLIEANSSPDVHPLFEIRLMTGLTWEQMARLCGVSRRSLHFWASGKPMAPVHEERLKRLISTIRAVYQGSAEATRAALLDSGPDGILPFDLLVDERYGDVVERIGSRGGRPTKAAGRLSNQARLHRKPRTPAELIDALSGSVHEDIGKRRIAKSVRIKPDSGVD